MKAFFLHNAELEARFETLFSAPCEIAGDIPGVFTAYTPLPHDSVKKKPGCCCRSGAPPSDP